MCETTQTAPPRARKSLSVKGANEFKHYRYRTVSTTTGAPSDLIELKFTTNDDNDKTSYNNKKSLNLSINF